MTEKPLGKVIVCPKAADKDPGDPELLGDGGTAALVVTVGDGGTAALVVTVGDGGTAALVVTVGDGDTAALVVTVGDGDNLGEDAASCLGSDAPKAAHEAAQATAPTANTIPPAARPVK